jgi:hypothetical protein
LVGSFGGCSTLVDESLPSFCTSTHPSASKVTVTTIEIVSIFNRGSPSFISLAPTGI